MVESGGNLEEGRAMAGAATQDFSGRVLPLGLIIEGKRLYLLGKRCMDVLLSLLLLAATLPLFALIALLIKLDSPGPVVFRQERLGLRRRTLHGKQWWGLSPFVMLKFRTMYHDSDSTIHRRFVKALILSNESEMETLRKGSDSALNKLSDDQRITRVGKVLRRTSLDELPQLWNVLMGEMSLVGPRPPLPYEVEDYEPRHWRRLTTIPGCVGLWQVSGWCSLSFEEMVQLDVWYIEHQSLWLDARILLRTVAAVLSGKGGL
jgi:lipopolysaccharide/colanic/teichoic acid biosynthesis glycosyltransferase